VTSFFTIKEVAFEVELPDFSLANAFSLGSDVGRFCQGLAHNRDTSRRDADHCQSTVSSSGSSVVNPSTAATRQSFLSAATSLRSQWDCDELA
jgi:hypothetical protein